MSEEQGGFRVMALGDGRDVNLAMESLWLTGRVLPVGARLVAVTRGRVRRMARGSRAFAVVVPSACLGESGDTPRNMLFLLAFDSSLEWFERELVPATDENRARARVFLDAVETRGGTELGPAMREALRQVGSNGTDVFVLTDGQVAATEDIVNATRDRTVEGA